MMSRRKYKQVNVVEDKKIAINTIVQNFMEAADQKELKLPPIYNVDERAYIHKLVIKLGLKSKSHGHNENRFLILYKHSGQTLIHTNDVITLQDSSKILIYNSINYFPLSDAERKDLLPPIQRNKTDKIDKKSMIQPNVLMKPLTKSKLQVPRLKVNFDLLYFRQSLNVTSKREEILHIIDSNRVVIIAGETGCGKTTQIPQFILESCQERNQVCKIICTQPRRLSAISVAERVAFERSEKIGETFGYQIRLETKVSSKTLLTYCTNGIFLRTLISEDSPLLGITHVIVDEVHERDRLCDFLLIALKDALVIYKHLKVILMSATIDTSIFSKYFYNCPIIRIPGKLYDVDIYYLEDVLQMTNYFTKETLKMKNKLKNNRHHDNHASKSVTENQSNRFNNDVTNNAQSIVHDKTVSEKDELESWFIEEIDKAIEDAWLFGGEDRFTHILYLICSENVPVDYQHSKNFVTTLMIAAGRGYLNIIQNLVNLGANLNLKSCNNWTACDWARNMNQIECAEFLEAYIAALDRAVQEDELVNASIPCITEDSKALLDIYHSTFNDENINYDLLLKLILHIHLKMPMGSILVFLPGYDEINNMKNKIIEEVKLNHKKDYNIYILHSNAQISDQKQVFKPSPRGCRKFILSTNIAETSITINDVVYVIDSGKVKEKSFDVITGVCTFESNWISQACAKQRTGRAGRCQKGICYRMYSSICYNNMRLHQVPEILRLPLQQLCLYTKHLTSGNTSIAKFLEKAIEPPSNIVINNAIQLLKTIGALDPWEDLTELGRHLLDLPIDPCLGKMLLHAAVLKCLDPILIIVCSLSHKDPFIIPSHPTKKHEVMLARKKFANNSYSDHMAILRVYQTWEKAQTYAKKKIFCEKYFLSFSVMEMVCGIKNQLVTQLKISGFIKPNGRNDINYLNSNSKNWAIIKAALTAGLYPNLIRFDRTNNQLKTQKESKVRINSLSVLKDISKSLNKNCTEYDETNASLLPCEWILYEELIRCGRYCSAKNVTLVNSLTVAIFSGSTRSPTDIVYKTVSESNNSSCSEINRNYKQYVTLKLDDWIVFQTDPTTAELILYLRQKWNALFLWHMKNPYKFMSQVDEEFMKILISVMNNEEQASKLYQSLNL